MLVAVWNAAVTDVPLSALTVAVDVGLVISYDLNQDQTCDHSLFRISSDVRDGGGLEGHVDLCVMRLDPGYRRSFYWSQFT